MQPRSGIKILRLRHRQAPSPDGCRWCGFLESEHPHRGGWRQKGPSFPNPDRHAYTLPTTAQTAARIAARRVFCMPDSSPPAMQTGVANYGRTRL